MADGGKGRQQAEEGASPLWEKVFCLFAARLVAAYRAYLLFWDNRSLVIQE